MTNNEIKETEAAQALAKKEGFARFMADPMAKALISTIPPCDHLEIVLRAAFDSGFSCGSVELIVHLIKKSVESRRP